jgi:hypothetical protein
MSTVLVGLLAAGLAWSVARWLRLRRRPAAVFAAVAASGALGALHLLLARSGGGIIGVALDTPTFGTRIAADRVLVRGTVSPTDARVMVAVRSEKDLHWWLNPLSEPGGVDATSGAWSISVPIGTKSEGMNQNFHLVALASLPGPLANLFEEYPKAGAVDLLPNWTRSEQTTIWRGSRADGTE